MINVKHKLVDYPQVVVATSTYLRIVGYTYHFIYPLVDGRIRNPLSAQIVESL